MPFKYIDEEKPKLRYVDDIKDAQEPDLAAQIAANPVTRFAVGAASPIIGVADRLAGNSGVLQRFNELAQQGGATGFDAAGLAGNIMNPLGLGLAKALPVASTLLGRTAQGAGMGALGGYVAPAENQIEALKNAGYGAAFGGVLPAVIQGGAAIGGAIKNKVINPAVNLISDSGPLNIARNYLYKIVGDKNVPATIAAARNANPLLPGSQPTVAEAVAGLPEGSPLARMQEITASTAGGSSKEFGSRLRNQNFATDIAGETRDYFTAPMREAALSAANKSGGIPVTPIVAQIDALAAKPGDRASDVVSKTLGAVRSKLETLGSSGPIDARDLYTVRKEIGNTIAQFSKENANWDKSLTSKLEREIQLKIDDAIEGAGGKGWKAYLAEFANRSRAIDADAARRELAKNPLQRTNLGGGMNIAEETRPHAPNLLSREAMAGNFILKVLGKRVEPKVDEAMTRILLNPSEYARVMSTLPQSAQIDINNALQRANALSFGAASAQ